MAKGNERTKYDLEKMPASLFPPSFDKLSGSAGARIVDAATGEATVEGVVGPSSPTLFSAAGTLFVFVIFIVWGIMIIVAYYTHLPTINEQTVDVGADFEAPFPDFAVVLNLKPEDFYVASQVRQIKAADGALTWSDANSKAITQWRMLSEDEQDFYKAVENRTLEFLWPVFRWEKITNGFSNKKDVHTLLGPEDGIRFGAAEAPLSPAAKRWKFLATNWKSLKRQMQSANYFQLLNSAPPEAPAPPPLDPRKFAELLERVKKLEEQVQNS